MSARRPIVAAALVIPTGLAALTFGGPYVKIAKTLTGEAHEWRVARAVVVPLAYKDGRSSVGPEFVAETLQTELAKHADVDFIDRTRLLKILRRLEDREGPKDAAALALKAARSVQADVMVTGSMEDVGGGEVELYVRLLRVHDGKLFRASTARVRKQWVDSLQPRTKLLPSVPVPRPGTEIRVVLKPVETAGVTRRVGDRILAFRYADQGGRPVIRVTDSTKPERAAMKEIPIDYDPEHDAFSPYSRGFRLGGRGYRMWSDYGPVLHVAPRKLVGGADEGRSVVIGIDEIFNAWLSDIVARMRVLSAEKNGGRVLAYFEPLGKRRIRISLFSASYRGRLKFNPHAVTVLRRRRRGESVSEALDAWGLKYRFRYQAATGEIVVEEARRAEAEPY